MTPAPRRSIHDVETPTGTARLHVRAVARPRSLVVLGHGAGRGVDTDDLLALAAGLPELGVSVVLVDQPWVVAGRRIAVPPAVLDLAWPTAVEAARRAARAGRATPLVVGGRSAGARVAARTVAATRPDALLLLAFPLVPPASRSDADHHVAARDLRRAELRGPLRAGIPVVVAQGERDPFGAARELRAALGRSSRAPGLVVSIRDADHALRTGRAGPDPAPALTAAALRAVGLACGE